MRLARILLFLVLLAGSVLPALSARAASDAVYSVSDIAIDKTGPSPVQARNAGQAEAKRRAARILLERLTLSRDHSRLPSWSDRDLNGIVQGVDVQSEQTRGDRYIATLRVVFRPEPVRQKLREAGLRFVEVGSRPYMLLPLAAGADGQLKLWDEVEHPWRQVWLEEPPPAGLVPLLVARGEASDLSTVSTQAADAADAVALRRLAEGYGATGAIVAKLSFGAQAVTLTLRRVDPDIVTDSLTESFPRLSGENERQLLVRVMRRAAVLIDDAWKTLNMPADEGVIARPQPNSPDQFPEPVHGLGAAPGVATAPVNDTPVPNPFPTPGSPPPPPPVYAGVNGLVLRAPLSGPASWVEIRSHLEALPLKTPLAVLALSRQEAMVAVDLAGGIDRLRTLLTQQRYHIEPGSDGIYTLQRLGAN